MKCSMRNIFTEKYTRAEFHQTIQRPAAGDTGSFRMICGHKKSTDENFIRTDRSHLYNESKI